MKSLQAFRCKQVAFRQLKQCMKQKVCLTVSNKFYWGSYQNIKHFTHDLDRHVYGHLDKMPLISWKAWSPNRTDLCLETFPHLKKLQDHSFSGSSWPLDLYEILDRTSQSSRYFRCGFICFMFGAVQFLNVLIITLLCVRFVWFSKDGWVATCLGKSCWLGLSPVISLFMGMCLTIFPFDVWDKLWVLIRFVLEVSLLVYLVTWIETGQRSKAMIRILTARAVRNHWSQFGWQLKRLHLPTMP